jgi:hypothetical protein
MDIKDKLKEMGKLFEDDRRDDQVSDSLQKLEAAAANL